MKTIFLSLLFAAIATFAAAQAPQAINYQAIARDAAGNPIPNQAIGVRFRILQGERSDKEAYAETFAATTNQAGLFNLQIGRGTPLSGTFADIAWNNTPCFLEVAIDPAGGAAYRVVGTSEMLSVPYALNAENVRTERQALSVSGNQLSISQGNTVSLPGSGCQQEIADCNSLEDTKVRTTGPGTNEDEIHLDLGTDAVNGDGVARTDVLVLRKNTNGNTMLEIADKLDPVNSYVNTFVGQGAGQDNKSSNALGDVILVPGSSVGSCSALPTLTSDAGTNLNGNNFYFVGAAAANNKDNVGIGLACSTVLYGKLQVKSIQNVGGSTTGIYAEASSNAANGNFGVQSKAGGSQYNYALYGAAIDPTPTSGGTNFGVFASASAASVNYGGNFSANNASLSASNYGV